MQADRSDLAGSGHCFRGKALPGSEWIAEPDTPCSLASPCWLSVFNVFYRTVPFRQRTTAAAIHARTPTARPGSCKRALPSQTTHVSQRLAKGCLAAEAVLAFCKATRTACGGKPPT